MCVNYLNTPRRVADETNNIVWIWESTPFFFPQQMVIIGEQSNVIV